MTEELRDKQHRFAQMVARLIVEADRRGYKVAFGEAWRTPEQAAANARKGAGISTSLHLSRLAVDLILRDKDGRYLTKTEDHQPLGEWWESIGGSWGGRFSKPDGNHYSLAHEGRR